MFGIRFSTGNIRPDGWSKTSLDFFLERDDKSNMVAVPKDYINNWDGVL